LCPSSRAFSALMSKTVAAPSFIQMNCRCHSATFFLKAGLILPTIPSLYPARAFVVSTIFGSPLRWGMVTAQSPQQLAAIDGSDGILMRTARKLVLHFTRDMGLHRSNIFSCLTICSVPYISCIFGLGCASLGPYRKR